jgi:hypothetical protein
MPLAISSALWSSACGLRRSLVSFRSSPLFEFSLPLEYHPAIPSRTAAADQLLSWALGPFSTSGIEDPQGASTPAHTGPPSGFDYPLDGFIPSNPCRFCFAPTALMGFTLRSLLLSKGIRGVTTRMHPHTVWPDGVPAAKAMGRPNRLRFLGFDPPESPWHPGRCLIRWTPDAPLGFALPGYATEDLTRDFARVPLTRFAMRLMISPATLAPQSIDQSSARLVCPATASRHSQAKQPS